MSKYMRKSYDCIKCDAALLWC